MKPKSVMLIAGEASGDLLAAELVRALRPELAAAEQVDWADRQPLYSTLEPRFFGAGGNLMRRAGVQLAFDLTVHSVTGLSDVLRKLFHFRRLLLRLYRLALDREPDLIICVDFSGFNSRFAHAIRNHTRRRQGWFHDWNPKLVQYVSPQVWASRPRRAWQMARDLDLVLSIFPFEKDWYAARVPQLRVAFVGHPMIDRYGPAGLTIPPANRSFSAESPTVLLLPGSRPGELHRHLPVMLGALDKLKTAVPGLNARMVLPDTALEQQAKQAPLPSFLGLQVGGLPEALASSDVAIASTGTVTMECAYFGVPTVALYKTSRLTYEIGKRIVTVPHLAMPNLLAGEEIFPEFIQEQATAQNIAEAALDLVRDQPRRQKIKETLACIIGQLGAPGASARAARLIAQLCAQKDHQRASP